MKRRLVLMSLSVLVMFSLIIQPAYAISTPSSWAKEAIQGVQKNGLASSNIFSDYQKPITREEFAMMAVSLYEKAKGPRKVKVNNPFIDISNSPYQKEIVKAYDLGIVNGIGGKNFYPQGQITREQIAAMFVRTLKAIYPTESYKVPTNIKFRDAAKISSWAKEAISYCYKNNILMGVGNLTIQPQSTATREQVMTLTYRLALKRHLIQKELP